MATSHHALDDLTNYDDHPQYLYLTGRATGQTAYGGIDASGTLTLQDTSHATPGTLTLTAGTVKVKGRSASSALFQVENDSDTSTFFQVGSDAKTTWSNGTTSLQLWPVSGSLLFSTPAAGSIEWDGQDYYIVNSIVEVGPGVAGAIAGLNLQVGTSLTLPYLRMTTVSSSEFKELYTKGTSGTLTVTRAASGDAQFETIGRAAFLPNASLGTTDTVVTVQTRAGFTGNLQAWGINTPATYSYIDYLGKFNGSVAVPTGKTFQIVDGAASGAVLTSDGSGVGSWSSSIATLGVVDTTFTIHDDSVGSGRTARFEVGSPAATEIVYTLPDSFTVEANTAPTLAVLEKAQTWTALQSWSDVNWRAYSNANGGTAYAKWDLGSVIAGKNVTLQMQATDNRILLFPDASTTIAGLSVNQTWTGEQTFGDSKLKLAGATSGALTLKAPAVASTYVATLPAATTTLAGLAVAQTFTASQTIAIAAGGGYMNLLDTGSGFKAILDMDSVPTTQDMVFSLPVSVADAAAVPGGTLAMYAGSSATLGQKFSTTGFDETCGATCSTASNGFFFFDTTTPAKRLRIVLSGGVGNNNFVISTTLARAYKFDNHSGTVVTCGNATAASGTLGVSNLTAQTGNIAATTLLTSSANSSGMFRVSFYLLTTTAGTGGDVVKVTVAYNDGAAQTADILLTDAIATPGAPAINHDLATLNKASYGSATIYCAASNAITFTTTVTKAGSPQYTLRARIEQLT